jgi:parallel beta-helix repeat protein
MNYYDNLYKSQIIKMECEGGRMSRVSLRIMKIFIVVTMLVLISFMPILTLGSNVDYIKEQSVEPLPLFLPHDVIRIDDNGGFNATNGVYNGTGAANDPYIIENLEIDGGGNGSCIYIGNTTAHFIVRNCSLYNATGDFSQFHWDAALSLFNVQNGKIINNTCFNNGRYGINLWTSSDNLIDNNTCYSNNINNIQLYLGNNNILKNNTCSSVLHNTHGISLLNTANVKLFDNKLTFCGIFMDGSKANYNSHMIPTNNTVNNKPVYYYTTNMGNATVPLDAGQVILGDASNLKIEDLSISGGGMGVFMGYSSNIYISNNTFSDNNFAGILTRESNKITISNNICTNNSYGIWLSSSSSNNDVILNNCSDNQNYGIWLSALSEYNNITYNTMKDNNNYGLNMGSGGNTLHHNNLVNNNAGGVQGYDSDTNNQWNDTNNRGNYWSDYKSRYPSAIHNGYFWNTSYDIAGTAGAEDFHPLVYPVEFEAPVIIDFSDSEGYTGEEFLFKCNITDNYNVSEAWVFYWFGTDVGNAKNESLVYNKISGLWEYETPSIPIDEAEQLQYNLSAVDPSNNWVSNNYTAELVDIIAPTAVAGSDWAISQGVTVYFNASLSADNIEITLYRWHLVYRGFNYYLNGMVRGFTFSNAGDYLVDLRVEDAFGNNDTDTLWVNVTDNILPRIYNPDFPASVVLNETIDIKINASDAYVFNGIHTMKLNYTGLNGTTYNVTMLQAFYTQWLLVLPGYKQPGIFEFYFWANDTAGNWNRTENYTIEILDDIYPKILKLKYPSSSEVNQEIKVTTEVDDNIGISEVRLNYSDVNGKLRNESMQVTQGTNYTYTIPGQTKTGTILFNILVVDHGNNSVQSNSYEIHIIKKHISIEPPAITWLPMPDEVNIGEPIEIVVNVSDELGVENVYLNYSDVHGELRNVSMAVLSDGNYSYTIPGQTSQGFVTLFISARNSQNIWNRTVLHLVEVYGTMKDESPPRIISSTPEPESDGIMIDIIIRIIFNESMNTTNVTNALKITPSTDYEFSWLDNNVLLKITFKNELDYNTQYILTIGRGATDLAGNQLEKVFTLTFTTEQKPISDLDSDSDGMDDEWELTYGLNPNDSTDFNNDSDGDGLTNLEEYQNDTNPILADTDNDNIPDDWELIHGLNPRVVDADTDSDGDFFTNFEEYENNTDPNDDTSKPKHKETQDQDDDYIATIVAIVVVIIIIIFLLGLLVRRSRRTREEAVEEEEKEEEEEQEEEVEEVECSECGAMVVKGEEECPECGADIEEEVEDEEGAESEEEEEEDIEEETTAEEIPADEEVPEEEEPEEEEPVDEEEPVEGGHEGDEEAELEEE